MYIGWEVKWCSVSRIATLWHAKDSFFGFRRRVGSWGPPGKRQNFRTTHILITTAVVKWLKYCRYCIKPQSINQSILLWSHATAFTIKWLIRVRLWTLFCYHIKRALWFLDFSINQSNLYASCSDSFCYSFYR